MLTRRHIRIKVMQSVYAFTFSENGNLSKEVRFYHQSLARTFELYLMLLGLFKALASHAREQITLLQKSHLKGSSSKQDNYKVVLSNTVLSAIDQNVHLKELLEQKKINNWELQFKFIARVFDTLFKAPFFVDYMTLEAPTLKESRNFLVQLFRNIIAPSEFVHEFIEDHELTWQDDIPLVNTFIIKQINQIIPHEPETLKFPNLTAYEADIEFGRKLLEQVIVNGAKLQEEFIGKTPNWEQERLALLDATLLKIAIAELLYFPTIPPKVTLNEYLEIAKDYSTPKSNSFVNGVLDKLVKQFEQENRLNKEGRGLK